MLAVVNDTGNLGGQLSIKGLNAAGGGGRRCAYLCSDIRFIPLPYALKYGGMSLYQLLPAQVPPCSPPAGIPAAIKA